ncbi:MAG: hypothetical protein QOJ54_3351 [Aliidongia sp.]|nr:hypothetical protein [Aliidongia sp.]
MKLQRSWRSREGAGVAERTILMTIIEADAGFTGWIALDGEILGVERALPPEHATAIRDMAADYARLFEPDSQPQFAQGAAEALGAVLHDIWFAPLWTLLAQRLGTGGERILTVASECPAILNLPWELWRPPGSDCVGADPAWRLRRFPWTDRVPEAPAGALRPGPLRVLYMVCAPTDQQTLDHEREEGMLLRALSQGRGRRWSRAAISAPMTSWSNATTSSSRMSSI